MQNLIGRRFNFWTVLSAVKRPGKRSYWNCVCSCGRKRDVLQYALTTGRSKSCGCRSGADLSQQRFGKLLAISPVIRGDGVRVWRCLCDCGEETLVRAQSLKEGVTSCGCQKKKKGGDYWKIVPSDSGFTSEQLLTLWLSLHRMVREEGNADNAYLLAMIENLRPWIEENYSLRG